MPVFFLFCFFPFPVIVIQPSFCLWEHCANLCYLMGQGGHILCDFKQERPFLFIVSFFLFLFFLELILVYTVTVNVILCPIKNAVLYVCFFFFIGVVLAHGK